MRITESKLRRIIKSIIVEDDLMRTRLAPMEKTGDYVEDAFALRTVTKDEENAINIRDVSSTVAYILALSRNTVVDEINLSPLKKAIKFK